jgi:hypothetical protein
MSEIRLRASFRQSNFEVVQRRLPNGRGAKRLRFSIVALKYCIPKGAQKARKSKEEATRYLRGDYAGLNR